MAPKVASRPKKQKKSRISILGLSSIMHTWQARSGKEEKQPEIGPFRKNFTSSLLSYTEKETVIIQSEKKGYDYSNEALQKTQIRRGSLFCFSCDY